MEDAQNMSMDHWWNNTEARKLKYLEKNHKSHKNWLHQTQASMVTGQ
jgi:hypothetical protein